jgi:hypothetical protein
MWTRVIVVACTSVVIATGVHVVWWRLRRPAADMAAIFGVFFLLPSIAYAALVIGGALGIAAISSVQVILSFVLHLALSCAYVQTYPAVQAQSPTLCILLAVRAARDGLDEAGIGRALDMGGLVGERANDLLRNGLLVREGTRMLASREGHAMAIAFGAYRGWLGLSRFGG